MAQATGQFQIDMQPSDGLLDDTARFDFTKSWSGQFNGSSSGTMLSAGDPQSGNAGYVAIERFAGEVQGRGGSFAFLQTGIMRGGETDLTYVVAPGSGTGSLAGISGVLTLDVDDEGVHHVSLDYELE